MTQQWHLDKSVSVGHILTTVLMIGGFVVWMMSQSDRITKLETQQAYTSGTESETKKKIEIIDGKVDQVLIRLGTP